MFGAPIDETHLPAHGSCVVFYKNGVEQGVAFTDIFRGERCGLLGCKDEQEWLE